MTQGLPSWSFSSSASSDAEDNGVQSSPWYQGDFVTSQAGNATSGDRTAPAGGGIAPMHLAIGAAALIVGYLLWRRLSK